MLRSAEDYDALRKRVAKLLNLHRVLCGYSASEVYLQTGVDVHSYESGVVRIDLEELCRLCDFYHVSLLTFLERLESQWSV